MSFNFYYLVNYLKINVISKFYRIFAITSKKKKKKKKKNIRKVLFRKKFFAKLADEASMCAENLLNL